MRYVTRVYVARACRLCDALAFVMPSVEVSDRVFGAIRVLHKASAIIVHRLRIA